MIPDAREEGDGNDDEATDGASCDSTGLHCHVDRSGRTVSGVHHVA